MIAAAGLVTTGISVGSSLLNQPNNSDPERFAKAYAWYQAAIQGDKVALCNLQYMGGRRGCAPGGCGGGAACGFATQAAKDYTEQLYQQALQVLAGALAPSTSIPAAPGASPSNPVLSQVVQSGTQGYQQQQALQQVKAWAPWVIAGAGVLVLAYLVMRARG